MDISVIVPVFNTYPESLYRCFESISFSEDILYEVIIVDDGSEDAIAEFCCNYVKTHDNFRYFRQENSGVSAARNAGIELAEGRYIMFVDSDDELIGDVLEKSVIESDFDLICFDHIVVEEGNTQWWKIIDTCENVIEDKNELLKASFKNRMNSACTKLYLRTLVQRFDLHFDEDMVIAEDAVFVLSVLIRAERVCYLPKTMYRYNHSSRNGSGRLIRFPQNAVDNLYCLYTKRIEALDKQIDKSSVLLNQYDEMRLDACVHFIEEIFNSLGTIWSRTNTCVDTSKIDRAVEMIRVDYWAMLPFKARIKCNLLRFNVRWMILLLNYIREYIFRELRNFS